jgi:UDP-GlcNAc:undecaprenyl-phosphate/decaprenyl-phosphate GlcNAc-1-phosphate transferase
MRILLAAVAGFVAARLLWLLLAPVLAHPAFHRLNYRHRVVSTAAGIVLALAAVIGEAVRLAAGAGGIGDRSSTGPRLAVIIGVAGFAFLGLIDDIAASGGARGLRGHVGALIDEGRLTTGGLKLTAGGAVAAVAIAPFAHHSFLPFVVDAALVALTANLANLFDRAPGRAIKVSVGAFVLLAAATGLPRDLVPSGVVIGAAVGLLLDDLHERLMLGDTGANALGAAIGVGLVATTSQTTRAITLAVVVVLTIASEVVSFTEVIDAVAPLRVIDRWGRHRR